jgi:hypothetical protein
MYLVKNRDFSVLRHVQTSSGTAQPVQWVSGAVSTELKWPKREVDHSRVRFEAFTAIKMTMLFFWVITPRGLIGRYHSHPSSTEVKNTWNYTTTPPYVSVERSFSKNTENFTSYICSVLELNRHSFRALFHVTTNQFLTGNRGVIWLLFTKHENN